MRFLRTRLGPLALPIVMCSLFSAGSHGEQPASEPSSATVTRPSADSAEFTVLSAGGQPVSRARVSVLGRAGSFLADREGRFRLHPIPPVPFELAFADERGTWLGLVRVEQLTSAGSQTVQLPRKARTETEVLVRSGLAPTTLAPPAAAPTVFSRAQIDEQRPSQLADALAEIPGTGRLEEGRSVVPTIRGLARSRVLLLLDDARVTAERRAGTSAGYLDPFSLENIEVVRGPGTVAYGSDALGGLIHARTPMPNLERTGGRFELAGGLGEKGGAAGIEANVALGAVAFLVQAHQRSFQDYEAPKGRIDNSSSRDRGLLFRGLLPFTGGRLMFGLQLDEARDMGKPALDSGVTRAYYPKENSSRLTLGADLDDVFGFPTLELRAFVGRYQLTTLRDRLPTSTVAGRLSGADVSANDFSLRVAGARPFLNGSLRVGLDVNGRYGLHATNTFVDYEPARGITQIQGETAVEAARRTNYGVFVETEQTLVKDVLSATLGLRGDQVENRNEAGFFGDRSRTSGAPSGFFAMTVTPAPGFSVTAQAARGFRDPLLSDRYFRGVSGRGFVVGNPNLSSEKSNQFDVAVRASVGPARLAAYAYLYRIQNLIERFRAGSDFNFRNRGEEEIKGAELEGDVELLHGLRARLALGVTQGRIRDDGSYAADIPPRSATLSLDYQVSSGPWLRVRGAAYQRDSAPGPVEKTTPGYALLDVYTGYRLGELLPIPLEVRIAVRNIFDKSYPATSDELAVDAPGRSATLVLAGSF